MSRDGSRDEGGKPWFGPRRFGFGLRPQTWQGWLVIGVVVVAGIVVAVLFG